MRVIPLRAEFFDERLGPDEQARSEVEALREENEWLRQELARRTEPRNPAVVPTGPLPSPPRILKADSCLRCHGGGEEGEGCPVCGAMSGGRRLLREAR